MQKQILNHVAFLIFTILFSFITGCPSSKAEKPIDFDEDISWIPTNNYANKKLNFYYYIPHSVKNKQSVPIIVMVNGLSSRGEAFVTPEVKQFAHDEGFIIVAPSFIFDEENWDRQESYQFPAAWSGQALLDIIGELKFKKNINPGPFYMMGYSAGAQYVGRFALLYPEIVSAAVVYAAGGAYLPNNHINVKFFVAIGNKDADHRKQVILDFITLAKTYAIYYESKEYDVSHTTCPELYSDALDFFAREKDGKLY